MKAPESSTAAGLVRSIVTGCPVSPAQLVDFGLDTEKHLEVMKEAVLSGSVTADDLWAAVRTDYDIDRLVEEFNPEKLHFQCPYALIL